MTTSPIFSPSKADRALLKAWASECARERHRSVNTFFQIPLEWEEVQAVLRDKQQALKQELSALQTDLIGFLRYKRLASVSDIDPEGWEEYGKTIAIDRVKRELRTIERYILGRHIDQSLLENAKQYPIESLFPLLRWQGNRATVLCPFHQEKTPSCSIDKAKNRFHCFGCGKSGDVIDLLQQFEGLTFSEAIKRLSGV